MSPRSSWRRRSGSGSSSGDDATGGRDLPGPPTSRVDRRLWILVVVVMAADVGLTTYGRRIGLVELNPVAREMLLAHGTVGLVALKGGALAAGLGCRSVLPARHSTIVPVCLAVPTIAAVVSNGVLVSIAAL